MKPQFHHEMVTSFALWLENQILSRGEAYSNKSEQTLFYQVDDRLDDSFIAFASPHKQWVTDSSVNGATIIDSVTVDGVKIERNTSGVIFDFDNGRVLIPTSGVNVGAATAPGPVIALPTSTVTADYSVKDFNIYITDQTEEELLLDSQFDTNSRFNQTITGGIKPYDQVLPAIFLSYEASTNKPFAFGGHDQTLTDMRCVVFAEDSYQLDGLFSILNDTNDINISNVGFNEHPLNEFGDLKYGDYSYADLSSRYFEYRSMAIINRVNVSKLNDRVAKKTHPGLFLGFADFELMSVRMPRSPHIDPETTKGPATLVPPLAPHGFSVTGAAECFIDHGGGGWGQTHYFSFCHDNAWPYVASGYRIYAQSGSMATGFGSWEDAYIHDIKSGDPDFYIRARTGECYPQTWVVGHGLGPVNLFSLIRYVSGVDYNYRVSAYNEAGETFMINPTNSGLSATCD